MTCSFKELIIELINVPRRNLIGGEVMRRWLKEIRMSQGIKQEEIADSAEISRGYYANIERGDKTPSVSVAKRIANYLKFDWTKFFKSFN